MPVEAPGAEPGDNRQLTIWDYRPRPAKPLPPKGTQFSLFGDEPERR